MPRFTTSIEWLGKTAFNDREGTRETQHYTSTDIRSLTIRQAKDPECPGRLGDEKELRRRIERKIDPVEIAIFDRWIQRVIAFPTDSLGSEKREIRSIMKQQEGKFKKGKDEYRK